MANVASWPKDLEMAVNKAPAAITADPTTVIGVVKFKGTLKSCTYIPAVALVGDASHNRTYTLTNNGAAGSGTTSMAVRITTVSLAANTENTIANSATGANLAVVPGDVLTMVETHTGNGIADPGGVLIVRLSKSS